MALTTRSGKGSALTHTEMDANFSGLADGSNWGATLTISTTTLTLSSSLTISGTIANLGTVTTADINGGTIDGATIGGASAGAGTFTTLTANTSLTVHSVTSAGATGTGNIVFSASPTFTGTITAATLNVTGASTLTGAVKIGAGVAGNTELLMVNRPAASLTGIQLFQDTVESWTMGMEASSGVLKWKASGSEKMSLNNATGLLTVANGLNVNGPATLGDAVGDSHTVNGALTITDDGAGLLVFKSGSGDGLRVLPAAAGSGVELAGVNAGVTDYEPLTFAGEYVVTSARTGVGTFAEITRVTSAGLAIGGSSFGTDAAKVLSITTGTAPSTGPADTVQFYSSDDAAGHTIPSFYCEGTNVIATGQADSVSSVRIKMRINGTVVTLLAI